MNTISKEACFHILQDVLNLEATSAFLRTPHAELECSSADDVAAKIAALEDAKNLHGIYDVEITSREVPDERDPHTGRMGRWTIILWHADTTSSRAPSRAC
jgi:hypothetical protein